jgi:hypothetical protein
MVLSPSVFLSTQSATGILVHPDLFCMQDNPREETSKQTVRELHNVKTKMETHQGQCGAVFVWDKTLVPITPQTRLNGRGLTEPLGTCFIACNGTW